MTGRQRSAKALANRITADVISLTQSEANAPMMKKHKNVERELVYFNCFVTDVALHMTKLKEQDKDYLREELQDTWDEKCPAKYRAHFDEHIDSRFESYGETARMGMDGIHQRIGLQFCKFCDCEDLELMLAIGAHFQSVVKYVANACR